MWEDGVRASYLSVALVAQESDSPKERECSMTQFHDRCGDCLKFPGNAKICKCEPVRRVRVVYALDMRCRNFEGRSA
jgi:NAD(P)H-nitrite reductase large subunit